MEPHSRFELEVFKLLLQVVSSDDFVSPEELKALGEAAEALAIPASEVAAALRFLEQGLPLPAPNLGLLRAQPQAALEAAKRLATSDRRLQRSEAELLQQLGDLLGLGRG